MDQPMEWILRYLPLIIVALVGFQVLRWLWLLLRRGLAGLSAAEDLSPPTRWQIQERIQQQLKFTPEELETNRTFQQASLRQRLRLLPRILLNLGTAVIGGLLLYEFVGNSFGSDQPPGVMEFFSENLFFLFFLGAATLPLLLRAGRASAELALGRVSSAQGPLSKQTSRSGRRQSYLILIEDMPYEVERQAYEVIPEGHLYRAHYFPYTNKLVSLELLQYQSQEESIFGIPIEDPDRRQSPINPS